MTKLVERQADIITELSSLCKEVIMLLAQYTDVSDYEYMMQEIEGDETWTGQP